MPDLMGGRFPIERPVALSGRPVLTPSACALCTAERPAFGPLGGHQPEEPTKRGSQVSVADAHGPADAPDRSVRGRRPAGRPVSITNLLRTNEETRIWRIPGAQPLAVASCFRLSACSRDALRPRECSVPGSTSLARSAAAAGVNPSARPRRNHGPTVTDVTPAAAAAISRYERSTSVTGARRSWWPRTSCPRPQPRRNPRSTTYPL
jgi:hypothetical protein